MFNDEWKYAVNRRLKLAFKKLDRQIWAILLNPEKYLSKRNFCIERGIKKCPFRFEHEKTQLSIRFCLAPLSYRGQIPLYNCFLLPYCSRGNVRAMIERAWKRRLRIWKRKKLKRFWNRP